jgi:hypothetical protein
MSGGGFLMDNKELNFDFSNEHLKVKLVKNVDNYIINNSSVVINLDIESIPILPANPKAIQIKRKLNSWKSDIFKNIVVKKADAIIIIEDENLENPNTENEHVINYPSLQLDLMKNSLTYNERVRSEIIDSKWEHVSKEYPSLNYLSLWKTKQNMIKNVDGFAFDPFYITGMTTQYDKDKEMSFKMKNYIWFAPIQTHCGIHNEHSFIEIHTQIFGAGRMVKFTDKNYMNTYETQRMLPGNTQSHAYCIIEEVDINKNKLKLSYPWHEYYSDTDCIWLVTEFWPV